MKYDIVGSTMQSLNIELEDGETIFTEAGAMTWMSPNIDMQTNMKGGVFKSIKRAVSGESLAMTYFKAKNGRGRIGFSPLAPGKILALDLSAGTEYICQRDSFMVAETNVDVDLYFQKKIMTGLFGGEGFIMQKLSGRGLAFVEIDGEVLEFHLSDGEELKVDTSHVALFEATVSMDIERVKGFKNIFLGGEGLFLTRLKGPGKVWLQTLPLANLAGKLGQYLGSTSGNSNRGATNSVMDLFRD